MVVGGDGSGYRGGKVGGGGKGVGEWSEVSEVGVLPLEPIGFGQAPRGHEVDVLGGHEPMAEVVGYTPI